jgi:hypothetical protein
MTYAWNHHGPAGMSSSRREARVDTTVRLPAAAAPRAVSASPSSWARPCSAEGATTRGAVSGSPSSTVAVSTRDTFRSTRGRSRSSAQAVAACAAVTPSPAPVA